METAEIFESIIEETRNRFDLLMSICKSPIEKIFVGKLYAFFYSLDFPMKSLSYDAQELLMLKEVYEENLRRGYLETDGYDQDHPFYKVDDSVGMYKDPITRH